MPKISIIVPVYRAELFLSKCVDSIIRQSFKDWELLLVEDGSPDRSGEICDEYASKDSRIQVIHTENGGVSSARNMLMIGFHPKRWKRVHHIFLCMTLYVFL